MSERLAGVTVAVLGFGNQGTAHAHNLRAHGVEVVVGARPGGAAGARARGDGFPTFTLADAARRAAVIAVLLPDEVVPAAWPEILATLAPDAAIVWAHGFNLLYGRLEFPARSDVVLVSPTGPGHVLRRQREQGTRLPAYIAVHRGVSGDAWALARSYGRAIDCSPLWPTTVREETEVDLFGEQAVLCGGMNALVRTAFEVLVERGYSPEIAYLECVHQLKYLADLLHERGPAGLRRAISGTALFGDLTRGPRVVGEESRREMRSILEEIRTGAFAREWNEEVGAGRPRLAALLAAADAHPLEPTRERAVTGRGVEAEGEAPAAPDRKPD